MVDASDQTARADLPPAPRRSASRAAALVLLIALALGVGAWFGAWQTRRAESTRLRELQHESHTRKLTLLNDLTHHWQRSVETNTQWVNMAIQFNQAIVEKAHPGLPDRYKEPLPELIEDYRAQLAELQRERRGLSSPVGLLTLASTTFDAPATVAAADALRKRWTEANDRFVDIVDKPAFPEDMPKPRHDRAWEVAYRRELEVFKTRRELNALFRALMDAMAAELKAEPG